MSLQRLIWNHTPRGGYGYTFRIPCVRVGAGRSRVRVAVLHARTRKVAVRYVADEQLMELPLTESEEKIVREIQSQLWTREPDARPPRNKAR